MNLCVANAAWKASPIQDGDRRLLRIEPSVEEFDLQDEKVLQEALWESRDYYLSKGNIDIDHWSKIPPYKDADGNPYMPKDHDPHFYEIGLPVEVTGGPERVVVVAEIRKGEDQADKFWKGITEVTPPHRWFPSIGAHRVKTYETPDNKQITEQVRWINVAMCKEPVNHMVKRVEIFEAGEMAKALRGVEETPVDLLACVVGYAMRSDVGIEDVYKYLDTFSCSDSMKEELVVRAVSVLTEISNVAC